MIRSKCKAGDPVTVRDNPNWAGIVLVVRHHIETGAFTYTIKSTTDRERVESKEEQEIEPLNV